MAERGLILIVDDEPLNVDLLEQELDLLGHDTIAAADGSAALAHLARQPVDLVLLDIMMPQLDGYEVLRRIKADADLRHVPVTMISALDQFESVVRCIELGAEDYLPKPFEPVLLKARVGACLEKKRWHDREVAYRREIEREGADRLLHAILPAPAVVELKASERIVPRRHDAVAVMFADIVGFTAYCETHAAEDVVDNLDRLARDCEALMSAHGLEKIKSIGDGFVTTGNLLQPLDDPVIASVRCALAMLRAGAANPAQWQLRGWHPRRPRGRRRRGAEQVQLRSLGRYRECRGPALRARSRSRHPSERRSLRAGRGALPLRTARPDRVQGRAVDRGLSTPARR
jgi:adenylate cyclase